MALPNNTHHIAPLIDILPKQTDTPVEVPLESFMRKQKDEPIDMLQGTLDMRILRTLLFGPIHSHAIAKSIERTSGGCAASGSRLAIPGAAAAHSGAGSLSAKWGTSENSRRARFYRLTAAGRRMLVTETSKRERLSEAIARILNPNREEV
jgi:PadR family transcriptional regulator, regulatory protein PadR